MARKKIEKYEAKRNNRIEVVLNEEERKRIIEMAKKEGLPTSTFIRWKLLKKSA